MQYQPIEADRKWAEDSYTDYLRQEFSWESHGEELLGKCGSMISIRPLGEKAILLQSIGDKSIKNLVEDFDEWVSFWFEWVQPWKAKDVNSHREVWTNWCGIPIRAWSSTFFSLVCTQVRRFVRLDKETEDKKNLGVARVLVSATIMSHIDKTLNVRIDGEIFKIRVIEESKCSCDFRVIDEEDEDELEEDTQPEIDCERSLKQAVATVKGDGEDDNGEDSVCQGQNLEVEGSQRAIVKSQVQEPVTVVINGLHNIKEFWRYANSFGSGVSFSYLKEV